MKKSTVWLLVAGGGVGLIGLIYVYRKQSQANTTGATDPSIDPATGIPYANEMGGGLNSPYGTTPSLYGYTDPSTGAFITGVGSGGVVTQPSTNASWAQQVEAYMQNLGYDPTAIAAALGKYLTGGMLTSDQQSIVQAAQGFFGNPPQSVPPIQVTPPPGQGGGGNPGHHPGGWVPIGGVNRWFSDVKDTLGKVKLNNSGWYKIHGQRVYYNKNANTVGYKQNGLHVKASAG
jgi:hypothetical protein